MVLQQAPHCHAPMHPAALVPTPAPHPALPLPIMSPCVPTVLIGGKPASVVGDMTKICTLPGCVPAGPGVIAKGSATVMIGGKPAARLNDQTMHASCVAPIPSPHRHDHRPWLPDRSHRRLRPGSRSPEARAFRGLCAGLPGLRRAWPQQRHARSRRHRRESRQRRAVGHFALPASGLPARISDRRRHTRGRS